MDSAEQEVVNWTAVKTFDEKKTFLKAYFDALSPEEMKWARNIAQRYKRDKDKRKKTSNVQTPGLGPVQPLLSTGIPPEEKLEGWWSEFKPSEILSIDCEMVAVAMGNGKFAQKAGSVSVCNYNGREVYKATVRHPKDTFLVDDYTREINGFERDSLVNGREIEDVRSDLEELFDGKLIIGHALAGDFSCLDLLSGDYDTFDLQWHWWWEDEDGSRKPFRLKALYKHFFPEEQFQEGVHEPFTDAKAVMRIFRFKYVKGEKTDFLQSKKNPNPVPEGDIDRLKVPRMKKKILNSNRLCVRINPKWVA